MSYIDTFDHEFVGLFGKLPVYHPLVDHHVEDDEFSCNPSHLIIGGGSGEHPAVILRRPDRAVASFVLEWQSVTNTNESAPKTASWSKQFLDDMTTIPHREALEFAGHGWHVESYHQFFERCCSQELRTPFVTGIVFEEWLLQCLGEFVLFAMPELVPEMDQQLPDVKDVIYPLYTNILPPPPGYPALAGRRIIDGKLVWGQRWWRNQA